MSYAEAKAKYAALGIDTDAAIAKLKTIPVSLHCWQGDDVRGFDTDPNKPLTGGIQTTGNYPGRARTPEELMADIDQVLKLCPGTKKMNLHASYAIFEDGQWADRDKLEPKHFQKWVDFCKERGLGCDFNPTFFSHPKANGLTLSSPDPEIRKFWIDHGKACIRISSYLAEELGQPCVMNIWTGDGFKDIPADRMGPRVRYREAIDEILSEPYDFAKVKPCIESKVFGIGVEAYTVGSAEFSLSYAAMNKENRQAVKRQLNVAAYCRVSTEEEEQQSSYEGQCTYYTDKIMSNPEWNMAGIFADEGISGTSTKKRDNFNRMIRKCRQKKIDLILTKSLSRFARNTVDSLKYIRALKELGIGIIFEKENINTLEMDTELIITFMSAFAQSESESISANVRWGKKQAMKEGKVNFPIWKLYGYGINSAGELVIVPEQAEVVRRIYTRILAGDSLRIIRDTLNADSIPAKGGKEWHESTVRGIITNEKYCGDVLMQKTFKTDLISGKIAKNTGQLPMYLIQGNHPGIVTRDTFQAVQTELARRSAGKSPSRKNAATGRSCYTSKYALSERVFCGECGTRYQRCSWHRKDKVRIVWRCVSRVEYGSRYCHQSPTMDEEPLQRAIMAAISSVMAPKGKINGLITDAALEETCKLPNSAMTLGDINRGLEELEVEFNALFNQSGGIDKNAVRFREIANEMAALKEQRERISTQLRNNEAAQEHVYTMATVLNQEDHHMTQWDEEMIRQLVHTVKVISADQIRVYLNDGTEIDQTVSP